VQRGRLLAGRSCASLLKMRRVLSTHHQREDFW
jgi:hypothetical protein